MSYNHVLYWRAAGTRNGRIVEVEQEEMAEVTYEQAVAWNALSLEYTLFQTKSKV